ncbi:restriction endonuclease subunit S [Phocaeicola vulgatus]|uniref:Type I restriction modification DNA specificity domain protein n=1 Tax=Bacteroides fragilis str. 3783N1-6 TaxID=1339310 RepID=A0AB73ANF5_BACFG|nr:MULTISPECIES: restriction endonuclease subunit S [Bacteroides]EYB10723.1 type I restriction modification DNA specificity domain protein [Bacteroides fragilis str. 3783N1-6]MCB7403267.1 restriction endonuclease subunit S [Bacteroides uniformis]MCS3230549.1 restriction endonuclease subunit S [Bacteroides thetaiotaomicron]MCY6306091.1 restriction endonuclease subunit S [Bacteroides fragilis]
MRFPEFSGEWEIYPLTDFMSFKNGMNPDAKRFGRGTKFISVMDILNNQFICYDNIRASVEVVDGDIETYGVNYGDILFQRSSETLEDVGQANVYLDSKPAVFGGFVIRGKSKSNYYPMFFRYLLASPTARKKIIVKGAGAQHFNIGQDGLSKVCLNIPSIQEQEKIAKLFECIDTRIATQNKIIEKLQSLIKGLSQQLLSSENDWILYRLDDLAQIKSGYSGTQVSYQTPYKVSRIETISKHCIDIQRIGYVECIPESYRLNVGNILFSNINSIQYIGNTAYLDKDYGLYHGMNLLRIIPNTTIVRPRFLHLLLCTDWAINHFQTICNKAVSQASINQTALGKSRFPIPPMSVQQQICSMFELTERKLDNEQEYISCLQQQKRYLLQKMFI